MTLPSLFDIQVSQQQVDRIVVGWLHVPGVGTPSPSLRIDVSRSYAIDGDYDVIAAVAPGDRIYVDTEGNIRNRWLSTYYKLTVTDDVDSKEYGPFYVLDGADRIARAITRRMNMMLANIGAAPVLIYQQVYNTDRCPNCWDKVTQAVIYSNCSTCGGTGFDGPAMGYYNPVLTLMDIRPPEATQTVEDTASNTFQTTGRMSNFPVLRPNDVIAQVNRGIIWRVVATTPQQKDHALMTQDPVSLVGVKPGDIEFTLPTPDVITPILTRRKVKKEKILQDNPDGTTRFLEIMI